MRKSHSCFMACQFAEKSCHFDIGVLKMRNKVLFNKTNESPFFFFFEKVEIISSTTIQKSNLLPICHTLFYTFSSCFRNNHSVFHWHKSGISNWRPAGHMRPLCMFNAARNNFLNPYMTKIYNRPWKFTVIFFFFA